MPNNPPANLVVNLLVFQAPDIFTKLSGISVAFISFLHLSMKTMLL